MSALVWEVDLPEGAGRYQRPRLTQEGQKRGDPGEVASFRVAGTIAVMKRIILMVVISTLAVACSSEEATPTIPGSDDVVTTSAATSAAPSTVESEASQRMSLEQASLEFTDCMRDEGIEFPDIRLDGDGRPQLGDIMDQVDTASPEFRAALASCSPILTRAGALELSSDPELQAVIIDQLAAFSECMRTNGVEGFPDPNAGFNGTGSPYLLGEIPFDDPEFQAATESCQSALGDLGIQD